MKKKIDFLCDVYYNLLQNEDVLKGPAFENVFFCMLKYGNNIIP